MGRLIERESTGQPYSSSAIGTTGEPKHWNLLLSVFTSISHPVSEQLAALASSRLSSSRCRPESKAAAGGVAFTLSPRQHGWGLVAQQPRHPMGRKQQRRLFGWSCCRGNSMMISQSDGGRPASIIYHADFKRESNWISDLGWEWVS